MDKPYTVYGSPTTGSVPIEAALTLIGVEYDVIGEKIMADVACDLDVNPLGQIPAMVLPTGEIMTESAAILVYLADQYPQAQLAPTHSDKRRPSFLRWITYVSAEIYSLAWIRRNPMRLVNDERQVEVVLDRIAERRAECWRHMDNHIEPGEFLLGNELSVLDLYVATVSRWSPRRARFYREAPRMAEIVRKVDADPRLIKLWNARFPFAEGWDD
jgi:GST-like protein